MHYNNMPSACSLLPLQSTIPPAAISKDLDRARVRIWFLDELDESLPRQHGYTLSF